MSKRIGFLSVLLIVSVLIMASGCGSKQKEWTRPLNADSSASIITYRLPDMDKVKVKKDIVYEEYNKLKLDVYYPLGNRDISKVPTVVLIHGIANDESLKDSEIFKAWGKVIAASGFTAITFNWRSILPQARDVSELINYIRENAKSLNINGENICVFGFSAGAMQGIRDAMQVNTGFIKKVVGYYGLLDESILTMNKSVKSPSFFIAMGVLDENFPPSLNENFINQAKAAGCNIITENHPKGGHVFDMINDEHTKRIIDKTLEFIDGGEGK